MDRRIYTIGHSSHPIDEFLDLLELHGVQAVADVRSTPYSRKNPQYNKENLQGSLKEAGIEYVFLGRELGARSEDPDCYVEGKVSYERLARTELFQSGIRRVEEGSEKFSIALMCAEKEPLHCHRTILVARALEGREFDIVHILANGGLESHREAMGRLVKELALGGNDLFHGDSEQVELAYRRQEERISYVRK